MGIIVEIPGGEKPLVNRWRAEVRKPLSTEEPDVRIVHKRSSPFGTSAAVPLGQAQQSLWDFRICGGTGR